MGKNPKLARFTPRLPLNPDVLSLRCREKSENKIPGESDLAWPQKTASNPMPIGSNLAVIDPYVGDRDALDAAIAIVRRHPERWREFQALATVNRCVGCDSYPPNSIAISTWAEDTASS
jgi:hypothetical protein